MTDANDRAQPNSNFRRETLWQIWVPLGAAAVGVLVLAVLVVMGNSASSSEWADISLIFLIIPAFIMALVILAIVAGSIYLLAKLLSRLPYYSLRARYFVYKVEYGVKGFADSIAKPVIKVNTWGAGFRELLERLKLRRPQTKN
jgi:hypothetical protein